VITFKRLGVRYGRLGNQLFQIAATIGIALKNRQKYVFPQWAYSRYFEHAVPQSSRAAFDEIVFRTYKEEWFHYMDVVLDPNCSWDLLGYFQTEKYFKHCEQKIRHYFQLKNEYRNYLQEKYGEYLSEKTCSIHVRRGDYVNQEREYYQCSAEYFGKAIEEFDNTTFLVFSDDIDWCKQVFRKSNFVFIEGEKDILDLYLMSMCQNNIIANSTFSWWAAWLNENKDKKVVAPGRWFGWLLSDFKTRDLIPEEWTKIEVHDNTNPKDMFGSFVVRLGSPFVRRLFRPVLRLKARKMM
jgi:hypothetical protein